MVRKAKIMEMFKEIAGREARDIDIDRYLCGYGWTEDTIRESLISTYFSYNPKYKIDKNEYEPFDPSSHGIEHLFFLYSSAIGGVERVVSLLLGCLPIDVQRTCAVITLADTKGLPFPEDVRVVFQPMHEWNRILSKKYKSIFVQPLIGFGKNFISAAVDSGSRVVWMVVSQADEVVRQGKIAFPDVVFMSTSHELSDMCEKEGLTPFEEVPHFVLGGDRFTQSNNYHRLAFVGRNSEEKNAYNLPLVLARLPKCYTLHYFVPKEKAPHVRWSNDILNMTAANIVRSGCEDRVFFTYDETDPEKIYSSIDVLLLPSQFEGYSVVAHEALIRGIPVVISNNLVLGKEDNPGLVEFRLSDTRFLDEYSQSRMVDAIAVAENRCRRKIWEASRHHSRDFFINNYLDRFMKLLGL